MQCAIDPPPPGAGYNPRFAADAKPNSSALIHQRRSGRLLERGFERAIFGAVSAADRGDAAQMIFRLFAVALLDLPEAVIIPGQNVVRIGLQRALIPDLGQFVVAELAIGVADQIGDVGVVVMAKRVELIDCRGIVVPLIDRVVGGAVALPERGIIEEGMLFTLLGPMARSRRRRLLLGLSALRRARARM